MSKPKRVYCTSCDTEKGYRNFYTSSNPLHKSGFIPYCKDCLKDSLGEFSIREVKNVLRKIDRPFIQSVWEDALEEDDYTFGVYMRHLGLAHNRKLTWEDSVYDGKEDLMGNQEDSIMKSISEKEVLRLQRFWGHGYDTDTLQIFEKKYRGLVSNYPVNTSLHEEALKTYCIYKVQAELATAKGKVDDAKKWGELAQKQGDIAKINLNKLTKSDLSQGLDGFSELARMVEETVDVITILPKFIAKPHDDIDFALLCYVNYMRRLEGRTEVSHSELYEFYNDSLDEHVKNNPELGKYLVEVETSNGLGGKIKIKTLDMAPKIKKLQEENPDDSFIKNLDKWYEVVSYFR